MKTLLVFLFLLFSQVGSATIFKFGNSSPLDCIGRMTRVFLPELKNTSKITHSIVGKEVVVYFEKNSYKGMIPKDTKEKMLNGEIGIKGVVTFLDKKRKIIKVLTEKGEQKVFVEREIGNNTSGVGVGPYLVPTRINLPKLKYETSISGRQIIKKSEELTKTYFERLQKTVVDSDHEKELKAILEIEQGAIIHQVGQGLLRLSYSDFLRLLETFLLNDERVDLIKMYMNSHFEYLSKIELQSLFSEILPFYNKDVENRIKLMQSLRQDQMLKNKFALNWGFNKKNLWFPEHRFITIDEADKVIAMYKHKGSDQSDFPYKVLLANGEMLEFRKSQISVETVTIKGIRGFKIAFGDKNVIFTQSSWLDDNIDTILLREIDFSKGNRPYPLPFKAAQRPQKIQHQRQNR